MSEPPSAPTKPKLRLQVWGIVIGSLLTFAPLWGTMGTVLGMYRAFGDLAAGNGSGIADPAGVSGAVHASLIATSIGILLCPVGLLMLILSLVSYSKRKKAFRMQ